MVSVTLQPLYPPRRSPPCPLERGLGDPHRQSEHCGEEKGFCLYSELKPNSLVILSIAQSLHHISHPSYCNCVTYFANLTVLIKWVCFYCVSNSFGSPGHVTKEEVVTKSFLLEKDLNLEPRTSVSCCHAMLVQGLRPHLTLDYYISQNLPLPVHSSWLW